MTYNAVSLSERETSLLRNWERARTQRVTLKELAQIVGPAAASDTAYALVHKGVLNRIGRGVYAVRPFRAVATPWIESAPVLVEHLLQDEAHYIGGLAAFTFHRLTQQHFASSVDVYVTRYLPSRILGNARVVFHRLHPDPRLFIIGITTIAFEGVDVKVSDPERTVLDALDRPKAAGGLGSALRLAAQTISRIDHSLLVDYAVSLARSSTCQRLGVLLERAGAGEAMLDRLRAHLADTKNLPAMLPARPRVGPVHPVWRIVQNDDPATEI